MSLRCLGYERIMFMMFSTCSEPRETIYNHISAVLAEFQDKFVKNDLFGLENDYQTHVIQKYHVSFCLCATYGYETVCVWKPWSWTMFWISTVIICVECLERFLRVEQNPKISDGKKRILVVTITSIFFFFLNILEVFGTWKNHILDFWTYFKFREHR